MKTLFVFDRPLLPSRGGAEVRALRHLEYLEKRKIRYDLFLVDRYNNYQQWNKTELNRIKERGAEEVFLHRAIGKHPDVFYRQFMSGFSLLSGYLPDAAHPIHALPGMVQHFRQVIEKQSYDFIFFNHTYVSGALLRHVQIPCRTVIDTHDIYANLLKEMSSIKQTRQIDALPKGTPIAKKVRHQIYHRLSSFKLDYEASLQRELTLLLKFNRIIAIAPEELTLFQQHPELRSKTHFVPMMAPLIFSNHPAITVSKGFHLLFIGSQYEPNVEAIRQFCDRVLPHLGDTVYLCLAGGVSLVDSLPCHPRLKRLGIIENLDELYAAVDAVILPLSFGSGVSVKAVEAFGYGKPVVATPKGVRGLSVHHGEEVLLAETVDDFIPLIEQLIRQPSLRESLSQRAVSYIQQAHSQKAVFKAMDAVIFHQDDLK